MWSEGERERSDEKIVMAESHMQLAKRDVSEVRLRVQIGLSGILHTKCYVILFNSVTKIVQVLFCSRKK